MSLMITESTPSFHSLVLVFMQPNNSSDVTAFGSTISQAVIHFLCVSESDKFFQTADLAVPGTPIKKQEWRTSRISASCTHFRTKPSSGYRFLLFATSAQSSLSFSSVFASALIPGNKSLIRPKKISLSSTLIFGQLKSLRALMSNSSSEMFGSARLSLPACLSTDFTARRPQS